MLIKSLDELKKEYINAYNKSIIPDETIFPKYVIGLDWIDKDKSVNWNFKQMAIANENFEDECERLQIVKMEAIAEIEKQIIKTITFEIGYGFTEEQAKVLLEKIKDDSGIYLDKGVFFEDIEDYIDLFREVLSAKD